MSITLKNRKPVITLTVLYVLSHFFTLLSRGAYWDGLYFLWLLQEKKFDILWNHLDQVKASFLYVAIRLMSFTPFPVFAFKAIAFISWFVAGISIYYFLKNKILLSEKHAFFIAAGYLLIPSFVVRVDLSVLHYSITNMFFFLAVLMYFTAKKKNNYFLK